MDEYERDEAMHERTCLRLAAWDMDQANTAAICIPHPNFQNVRAVMQTGLAVAYARPFTIEQGTATPESVALRARRTRTPRSVGAGIGARPDDPSPTMTLRDKVYAHTDKTHWRTVEREGVRWSWMTPEFLADVAAMTERQRNRFKDAARERKRRLDAAD